jgi:hypothetical protein
LNSTNGLYKHLVDTFGALLDSEWVDSKSLNFLARNVFKDLDAKFSNLTNETNSFYVRFVEMKNKYPHLIERYPLLDKIESNIQENYGKGLYVGLKLSENVSDVNQVETYMQNLVDMREFYDKNLSEEENAEVREFLKDFGDFLVYQNVYNSQVNLASTNQIMPYQFYSRRMAQAMSKIASMPKNMKKVIIENIKTGNNVNLETPSYASRIIVGTISEANKNDKEVLQVSGVRLKDVSDKDINNSFATIDLMVSAIIDKFNAGIELIEFPEKGLGQDLKAKSPVSFEYLSQKMYELTGYRNPNAEIIEDLDNTEETPGCTLPI